MTQPVLLEPLPSESAGGRAVEVRCASVEEAPDEAGRLLRVDRLGSTAEILRLGEEWNRLAEDVPFRRWEWLDAWWQHFAQPGDELFVVTVRDDRGRLVGLAPWYIARSGVVGRVIRFLGSGQVCSDYLTILSDPTLRAPVIAALESWLLDEARDAWDALELEAVERDDPATSELVARLRRRGHVVQCRSELHCWRLTLADNWEDYLKRLSGGRRNLTRKLTRQTFEAGKAIVRWSHDDQSFEHGWAILVDLHQRRRRSLGQPGCFADERFARFLKLAARRFLAEGMLRLQWVELEGKPVAAEIDFASRDTVYMYQSGIEPQAADKRPGWLGTIAALRRAMQDGYRCFDFMRGDEPYKAHWRAQPRPLVSYRVVGPGWLPRWRHRIWLVAWSAKRAAKATLVRAGAMLRRESAPGGRHLPHAAES
jgi:CelD/BcsL family acetyltransferase involved in cellulose biosynthesis